MDPFDEFPGMSEKEVKKFVGQYFTAEGKPKFKNAKKRNHFILVCFSVSKSLLYEPLKIQ